MKVSYNWLKEIVDFKQSPEEIGKLLTDCGLEVEHIEQCENIKGGLKGLIVGHVVSCEKHPGADRLKITKVNVGDGIERQVVCGAPNVEKDQKVVVALPGTTVYPTQGEPFEIKNSKIRGEVSEGMLCAEDEIGLGSSHAGLLLLPTDAQIGTKVSDLFKVETDYILEIGLTPNRADAASHLGVARDIVALLNKDNRGVFNLPDPRKVQVSDSSGDIKVDVQVPELCARFSGIYISNIKVAPSPDWLKNRLQSLGIRAINNIVDITNYVMHYLGQPLHAYDANTITGNRVVVALSKPGTEFQTLDGISRKLDGTEMMVSNSSSPMCIAGVMGGLDSGVNAATTSIFLECAYFNAVAIRKAAKRHTIHSDSSFRFERGVDPEGTVRALIVAAELIEQIAGGKLSSTMIDFYPQKIEKKKVQLSFDYVKSIIGAEISRERIKEILNDLEIEVVNDFSDWLEVAIPAYRVDVTRPADLVEEILRIYGYNNISFPDKIAINLSQKEKWNNEVALNKLSSFLVNNGFNEILNNSLNKASSVQVVGKTEEEVVLVLNPLSNDLSILRPSMLIPGLETIAYNINRRQKDLMLFEQGKVYFKQGIEYKEEVQLGLWMTGNRVTDHWKEKNIGIDFFYFKSIVQSVLKQTGIVNADLIVKEIKGLEVAYTLVTNNKVVVEFGKVSNEVLKYVDVQQPVWYAVFRIGNIVDSKSLKEQLIPEPPKFPEVRRDLSMIVDNTIQYSSIESLAYKAEKKLLRKVNLFDVYNGEKIATGKKSLAMSFTLRDDESTLQDKQIDAIMNKIMKEFEQQLGAEIRREA